MGYKLNLLRSFYEYHHGYTKLHTLPLVAEVELTNLCNLKCGFCNREVVGKHGFGMMPLTYFIGLAGILHEQMVHTRLFLHGESTLNPDLVSIVRFLSDTYRCYQGKKYVKSIGFTTNGTLLDADLFKRLIDAGLDNLEFSFEGTDKETYESLRKGADFEAVKKNIRAACKINFDLGCPVNIGINIIDCKQIRPKLENFIEEWKGTAGLNRVDIGVLGDWAGSLNVDEYKTGDKAEFNSVCSAPWFTCSVLYNGDVVPCCKLRDVVMGNVFHGHLTFRDIWSGPKYRAFRKEMLKGREKHSFCRDCKSNLFSVGSPYLVEPNVFYPFTKTMLNQVRVYRALSGNKKYVPLKEKQK